jgi:CDP-paratose 2-epimerase
MPTVLVTGSAGLIGSEAVHFFAKLGFVIIGIDNDFRAHFFGKSASTRWNRDLLKDQYGDRYKHYDLDIRDRPAIEAIFKDYSGDIALIIHTAAQPSHDWAAKDIKIPPRTSLKSVRCRRSLGVIH